MAIKAGIDPREFWDYSYQELCDYLDAYKQLKEEEAEAEMYKIYTISALTAKFVNTAIQGKKLPDIYDVFPTLPRKQPEFDWKLYEQQFLQYANGYNSQRGSNR